MKDFPEYLLNGYKNFMSDSRSAPETIFDCGPGELFVMRNVANMVPPFEPDGQFHATSAAIEYAVQVLKVKDIVVMGHGRCGGIQAALDPNFESLSPGDFIGKWMNMVKSAAEQIQSNDVMTSSERQTALERVSIRNSINNLRGFPFVKAQEVAGKVKLHGAWFDISTGELWVMDSKTGDFRRPEV
jgi:carbonic anhydrase